MDTVQVIYNVFDQSPEDELLAACERIDVGVIARVPLDEGGLTGRVGPDTSSPRATSATTTSATTASQQVDDHVDAILADLGIEREELPEVALRYVLSRPEVSTVIPGMRSVRNVERNAASATAQGLPAEQVQALKAHRWDRNFYA